MGVDILGKDPSSEIGRHFGRNWFTWEPLADYILGAPDELPHRWTTL
jgi:hypothetical protein